VAVFAPSIEEVPGASEPVIGRAPPVAVVPAAAVPGASEPVSASGPTPSTPTDDAAVVGPPWWDGEVCFEVALLTVVTGTGIGVPADVAGVGLDDAVGVNGELVGVETGVELAAVETAPEPVLPEPLAPEPLAPAPAAAELERGEPPCHELEPVPVGADEAAARGPVALLPRVPFSCLSWPGGPSPFGPRPSNCEEKADWLLPSPDPLPRPQPLSW
jgi:hypothetical protein